MDGVMARAIFKFGAETAIAVPRETAVKHPRIRTPQTVKNLSTSLFRPAIQ